MRPFNPFMQRRQHNVEVTLKTCTNCHGKGIINEDNDEILCSICGGSGEIIERRVSTPTNPNTKIRK